MQWEWVAGLLHLGFSGLAAFLAIQAWHLVKEILRRPQPVDEEAVRVVRNYMWFAIGLAVLGLVAAVGVPIGEAILKEANQQEIRSAQDAKNCSRVLRSVKAQAQGHGLNSSDKLVRALSDVENRCDGLMQRLEDAAK